MKSRRPYKLLAAAAALGAIVAYIEFANTGTPQSDRPVNSGQAAPRTAALSQDAAGANRPPGGNPLWALPLKQLSNTRERPIFSPSRRPPPPATPTFVAPVAAVRAPPPKEPERPPITLLGTILGSTESIGVFFNPTTRDIVRLRVGEDHSGWALFSIKTREATLVKDRQRVVLEMPPPGESGAAVNDFSQPPPGVRPSPAQRQQRH